MTRQTIRLYGSRENRVVDEKSFQADITNHPSGTIVDFNNLDEVNQRLRQYVDGHRLSLHIDGDPYGYAVTELKADGSFTAERTS